MLTPSQADKLRTLITRHATCQFQAGRLNTRTDPAVRARVHAAADIAKAALCAELSALTLETVHHEADLHELVA